MGAGTGRGESLKDCFEDYIKEQVAVHMFGYDGFQRGNYFGGELM